MTHDGAREGIPHADLSTEATLQAAALEVQAYWPDEESRPYRASIPWAMLLPILTELIQLVLGKCTASSPEQAQRLARIDRPASWWQTWNVAYDLAHAAISSRYWWLGRLLHAGTIHRAATALANDAATAAVRAAAEAPQDRFAAVYAAARGGHHA